jgi:hypothetical protein
VAAHGEFAELTVDRVARRKSVDRPALCAKLCGYQVCEQPGGSRVLEVRLARSLRSSLASAKGVGVGRCGAIRLNNNAFQY